MREQRAAMEKELGSMQAKAQGSYQELQTMQIKVKALISCRSKDINFRVCLQLCHQYCTKSLEFEKCEGTHTFWQFC